MADQMLGVSTDSISVMGEPLKLQDLLRYRATMIWDGYIYQRERTGKNRSWWRCRRNRPRDKEARMCMGRAVYKNQKLVITVGHSHGPETTNQNFVPSRCTQSAKKNMVAAVKGFVLSADQDLLQSEQTSNIDVDECDAVGERPTKLHKRMNYRSTMVWDGYIYNKQKTGKTRSWWRCRKNRSINKKARQCFSRAEYHYSSRSVVVTVKHSHGPESTHENYVPPHHGEPKKNDPLPAVKGFVSSTDQALLQSRADKHVVKHHQCDLCEMKFAIARVLETHKMLEHQVCAQWKCSECGMQFLEAESHSRHMNLSHPTSVEYTTCNPFNVDAETIPKESEGQTKLEVKSDIDLLTTMAEKMIECMPNEEEMVTESKHNAKEKPKNSRRKEKQMHKCEYCSAEFRHPCKLKVHIRLHTGEKPYKCTLCPRTFTTASRRGSHFKSAHDKIRRHLCDWCGKKFSKLKTLTEHVRTHTGEKPYSCSVCSRQFRKRNAMMVHIRQHTGEKPYVCDQCGQSFTVKVSLRAHLKSKHNIIVKTDVPVREIQPGDSSVPRIGRPKKSEAEKQLFLNKQNGHLQPNNVSSSSVDLLDNCSVLTLSGPDSDVIATNDFCSISQF